MNVLAYDPYLSEIRNRGAGRAEGRARRSAAPLRLRLDQLPADQGEPRHDRREAVRADAAARLFHHHRARLHPRRGRAAAKRCGTSSIAGAGLDVWSKEPPPPEHPLLQFDNVLASPHTAGVTREARENMGRIAAEQILDALDGKRPPRIINPEVWPHYSERFARAFGVSAEIGRRRKFLRRSFTAATKLLSRAGRAVGTLLFSCEPSTRPSAESHFPLCAMDLETVLRRRGRIFRMERVRSLLAFDAVADQPADRALCRDRGREPARRRRLSPAALIRRCH